MLIDAGDTTKGKTVVEALKRHNIQQLDYFIATHPHPDHMGGAAEVFKAVKVLNVIDNGQPPSVPAELAPAPKQTGCQETSEHEGREHQSSEAVLSLTKFYDDYKEAVKTSGAQYGTAQPGRSTISAAALC